ncbi:aspartyl-phosphate phosphatase Spo0E family protein [Sediminibacillus massiliensis]|uniref:aspartyl-phosphate phosphatase Spo0E family protein n=1 Tax=Sediminibacillus massiliensis TaxID=1926277 RepID=UPI00098837CD|nr:aspartyl-phosphate phosphatase Spo0E family protein [Sediminibacillus massiliensis]
METVEYFKTEIEELRLQMYDAYAEDPTGNRVLTISQKLDKVINKVQKMKVNDKIHFNKKDIYSW